MSKAPLYLIENPSILKLKKRKLKTISDLEHPETGAALDVPEPDGVVRAAGDHESAQDKMGSLFTFRMFC